MFAWCKLMQYEKQREKFFFVVNIIYSPVAALPRPFHHVTEQRLRVHARCSATQVGFHIPDLQLWLWRLKEKSDSELLDIPNTSSAMMLSILLVSWCDFSLVTICLLYTLHQMPNHKFFTAQCGQSCKGVVSPNCLWRPLLSDPCPRLIALILPPIWKCQTLPLTSIG